MNKIGIISSYINRCAKVIEEQDIKAAEELEDEIVSVYNAEIKELTTGLDNYAGYGYPRDIKYLKDIKILKAKLENYKSDIKRTPPVEKTTTPTTMNNNQPPIFNINNTAISNATNEVTITLEQAMKNINELPSNILTDDDKQDLEDKLASLQVAVNSKDKEKIGTKLLNVLKFAITKGPETYIAISSFINFIVNKVAPLFK